ncbi:hypothetical protein [Anaeromyxobacter sp. Fw109-5]|uniref:hypothetical protein n=1 Tax=Anaeromyxobacter sp. (strain Fw109-5) TaxID=404589 RepID=UPI00117D47FB|nr:hypothetical protein [Anaeromyxobacter sp. Fw109-5]
MGVGPVRPAGILVAMAAGKAFLLLAVITAAALPVIAHAELDVRVGGRQWATVEDDGTVRVNGLGVGRIEPDGTVRRDGRSVGEVEPDGTIRASGRVVGRVERDGTVRRGGRAIGAIEDGGTLRRDGRAWGSIRNCCGDPASKRTIAALLAFFADDWF